MATLTLPAKPAAAKPALQLRPRGPAAAAKVAPAKAGKPPLKLKAKQQELPFADEAEVEAQQQIADHVRTLARGFRLQFGSLGGERTLKDADKRQLIEDRTDADMDQMRIVKTIYAPHPELKRLSQAQRRVRDYFDSRTLPFPDGGVRLFMVDMPRNAAELSETQIDESLAEQTNRFREEMREQINEYEQVVRGVQNVWQDILSTARGKLKSQFDLSMYPLQSEIPAKLHCTFSAYNLDLSRDYKYLSPAERERELAAVRQSFQAAVAKQEEFVISMLDSAIDQFVSSITNFNDKKTRCFKDSVVTRVFDAFTEFQQKTVKYGILKGTQVEGLFSKVRKVLREGGQDASTLPDTLRKSEERRETLLKQMSTLHDSLIDMAANGQAKRRLL